MTETIFGKNVFDVHFDVLVWPMSHLLTWSGRGLWPILGPATRGQSRCFGCTFLGAVMSSIFICNPCLPPTVDVSAGKIDGCYPLFQKWPRFTGNWDHFYKNKKLINLFCQILLSEILDPPQIQWVNADLKMLQWNTSTTSLSLSPQ